MAKGKNPFSLFKERLIREGRYKFYRERYHFHHNNGMSTTKANALAREELGYKGTDGEREAYEEYLRIEATKNIKPEKREEANKALEELIEGPRDTEMDFVSSLDSLPAVAPSQQELEWVRAHPAMMRMARANNPKANVVISSKDVWQSPHGPAPSRSAVNQLIYFANRPDKFYEQLMGEQKKVLGKVDEAEKDKEIERDPTLEALWQYVKLKVRIDE